MLKAILHFFIGLYRLTYIVGIQTVRICARGCRRVQRFFQPLAGVVENINRNWILPYFRWLWLETVHLFAMARKSVRNLRHLKARTGRPTPEELAHHRKQVWRHMQTIFGIVINVVAPVLSLILLFQTIGYWTSQSFGLALEYNGHYIGMVEKESDVDDLIAMVATRLQGGHTVNIDNVTPTYELTTKSDSDHFTPNTALCDSIVANTKDINLKEAYGLYVDGEFIAAIASETDMRYILQSILRKYDAADGSASAAFIEDVQLVKGLYTSISVLSSRDMQVLLNSPRQVKQTYTVKDGDTPSSIAGKLGMTMAKLKALNPGVDLDNGSLKPGDQLTVSAEKGVFTIKMQKKITYTRPISYKTVTEKTDSLYVGTSKVKTQGVNGTEEVVDLITYIDGVEVSRENISKTVIKQPVNKVVQVGTKKKPTISSVTTGKMMWPVPSSKWISDGFGYVNGRYHGAIDIVCSYVRVVAADGGKVVSAGWHYGYGWCILIQHANGLQTFYAHMSRLNVSAGQTITKGTTIGTSGNSGSWSLGAHLHFEVRLNGNKVNPLKYVSR